MKKTLILLVVGLLSSAVVVSAQIQPMEKKQETKAEQKTVVRAPAPERFAAKYEGGMFGNGKREMGTLKFEDANQRIVFYGKDQKEKFSIPYKAMLIVSPNSKSQRSTTGQVIGAIPVPGASLASLFIREKLRYLVINFDDPQVEVQGMANFKLANKELLASVIQTLGEKANMLQRGDAYYRPKDPSKKDE